MEERPPSTAGAEKDTPASYPLLSSPQSDESSSPLDEVVVVVLPVMAAPSSFLISPEEKCDLCHVQALPNLRVSPGKANCFLEMHNDCTASTPSSLQPHSHLQIV